MTNNNSTTPESHAERLVRVQDKAVEWAGYAGNWRASAVEGYIAGHQARVNEEYAQSARIAELEAALREMEWRAGTLIADVDSDGALKDGSDAEKNATKLWALCVAARALLARKES